MATAQATDQVQPGKLYLLGLKFPSALNEASPVSLRGTANAESQRTNAWNERRHLGLVISVDCPRQLAIILIGTSHPSRQHRYLPWAGGTPRLSGQPLESIVPVPPAFFQAHPGYLNFTHAIRVRIMGLHDIQDHRIPGVGLFHTLLNQNQGQPLPVYPTVPPEEIEKIRRCHQAYWQGTRLESSDGSDNDRGDSGGLDAKPNTDITHRLAYNVQLIKSAAVLTEPVGEFVSGNPSDDPCDRLQGSEPHSSSAGIFWKKMCVLPNSR